MYRNILTGIALVFGISGFILALNKPAQKSVCIDMAKVYEGFDLSKELNQDLEKKFSARKSLLDSLYKKVISIQEKIRTEKNQNPAELNYLKALEEDYIRKQSVFEKENQTAVTSANEKIWKQINKYTEDYGKENGYDYILGTTGQGNIMYASTHNDISDALINYINTHYNDKAR